MTRRFDSATLRVMKVVFISLLAALLSACTGGLWNNPYPVANEGKSILYTAFTERPKHLDPAQAYSENEYEFLAQIYAPPLQYHYLKRPYQLVPLAAAQMPTVRYLDERRQPLPDGTPAERIAFSVYEIRIRPGIHYQPHPAFARDPKGDYLYRNLTERELARIHTIADFPQTGTRELTAADYIYQIKRLAHPKLHSPILSVMHDYIVGLRDYTKTLKQVFDGRADSRDGGGRAQTLSRAAASPP